MPAKKPAPRSAKGKKAASRPTARKTVVRKPSERAKAAAHVRKATATPRRATSSRATPITPEATETTAMRKVAEPAPAGPVAELPGDDAPENLTTAAQTVDPVLGNPEAEEGDGVE